MRALLSATLAALTVAGLASCTYDGGTVNESVTATPPSEVSESPSVTSPPDPSAPDPSAPKPPGDVPSVSVSPSGVVVPPGVTQVPAAQIDAGALPVYYEHRGEVWVSEDGRTLQMFAAASSGCSEAEAVVLDQSPADIKITLRPLPSPPGGRPDDGVCTAVITPKLVSVGLDEPLGDRKILLASGR